MSTIADNIARVRERIAAAAARAGRSADDVTLIAVTKTMPAERVREAVEAGVLDLGESYAQEAREKLPLFGPPVRWHFIGHLQTNKARYVAGAFSLVHSVDSLELAREIGKRAARIGVVQDILLEAKLDPADTKFGAALAGIGELAATVADVQGVRLCGLMGMAPYAAAPENARPYFHALRQAAERLPAGQGDVLSMGMSGDFEVAVEEGATHVRVGTAIFGPRLQRT